MCPQHQCMQCSVHSPHAPWQQTAAKAVCSPLESMSLPPRAQEGHHEMCIVWSIDAHSVLMGMLLNLIVHPTVIRRKLQS